MFYKHFSQKYVIKLLLITRNVKNNSFNRHDGVRKTSVGKELAKKLNVTFIDIDQEIEKNIK